MRIRSHFVFAVMLAAFVLNAHAQSPDREGLRGVRGMRVVIEQPPVTGKLTAEQLRVDVELRLRKAGVSVLDDDAVNAPFLYLNFFALKSELGPYYATNITLELKRVGTFVGVDKNMKRIDETLYACVWSRSAVGILGGNQLEPATRQRVADITDQFLTDYLAVNPNR